MWRSDPSVLCISHFSHNINQWSICSAEEYFHFVGVLVTVWSRPKPYKPIVLFRFLLHFTPLSLSCFLSVSILEPESRTSNFILHCCCLFIAALNTEFTAWWLVSHLAQNAQVLHCTCFYLTNISTVVVKLQLKRLFTVAFFFRERFVCFEIGAMRGNQLTKALCLTSSLPTVSCFISHWSMRCCQM